MNLICRLFGHSAKRDRARHDGDYYWTSCKRCAALLLRDRGGWREPRPRDLARHESNLLQAELDRVEQAGVEQAAP